MQLNSFQLRVDAWMLNTFGKTVTMDKKERIHRFIEEALELAQSLGYTREEVDTMVHYAFMRPKGEPIQEVGGVLVTLSALCTANQLYMENAAGDEIFRCEANSDKIRAKHNAKPDSVTSSKTE